MARVLGFLIRYFSNYYTLHLAARAAPLDPRLIIILLIRGRVFKALSIKLNSAKFGLEGGENS